TVEEQPENFDSVTRVRSTAPQKPSSDAEEISVDKVGLELSDLTADFAAKFGYSDGTTGAFVSKVQPGSVAADKGMFAAMRIVKISQKPVNSAKTARELLEKGSLEHGILLQVQYPPALPNGGSSTAFIVLKSDGSDK